MQIRPVKPEEIDQFMLAEKDAFQAEDRGIKDWFEVEIKPTLQDSRVIVDDDGQLKSFLHIMFPRLWLGRDNIPMPGIRAVATPPEYRRQAHLKRLLIAVMHELREQGYGISTLYPFYFPFYKKFGYEQVSTSKNVEVKLSELQKFKSKAKDQWKQATPEQWQEFDRIYNIACQGKFGAFTRNETWWKRRHFRRGLDKPNKLYLWYDEQDQAQAYVIYNFTELDNHDRRLNVNRAWTNQAAWHEIMAFVANHDSQASKVAWYASTDEEVRALLDNPREGIEEKLVDGYMLRILDAARALQERPWPTEASGVFTIALKDNVLEWNNQALRVTVTEGRAQVQALAEAESAGLSCDIRQLAQMYAAYLSPVRLAEINLLEVHNPAELAIAQKLFSPIGQPASHMPDFF